MDKAKTQGGGKGQGTRGVASMGRKVGEGEGNKKEGAGPDLRGCPGGPGPRPPTNKGPPTKPFIFYFWFNRHS